MVNGRTFYLRTSLVSLGTILLWGLMASLGVVSILALREMAVSLYVLSLDSVPILSDIALLAPQGYNQTYWLGVAIWQRSLFFLALLWMAVVIGGAEYLYLNLGQPKAWRFLGWTIGIEFAVLTIGLLI